VAPENAIMAMIEEKKHRFKVVVIVVFVFVFLRLIVRRNIGQNRPDGQKEI
jgi:hypothetical protein